MSGQTLARRFESDIGMSLRSWRRRMGLFKAIEMLGGNMEGLHAQRWAKNLRAAQRDCPVIDARSQAATRLWL
jgi:hypothetical protein